MPVFFLYLFKLSLSLAVVYFFYALVLRRLTFYRCNRLYLLAYPLACFLIPLIDVTPLLQQAKAEVSIVNYVPLVQNMLQPAGEETMTLYWAIAIAVLAAGMLALLCRLLVQYFSVQKIKKQSVLLSEDGIRLYQVNSDIIPFSFANAIYINQHNHTPDELKEIIRHEYVHVKQRHSFDILLGELLCIINWYNPFVWLLRRAIRQNLEFVADNCVIESGIDKKAYQYLLLKVVGVPQFSIVNQFNFSSLKKRIVMMNKMKTARVHLVKFAFVLPLAAILLLAFREKIATGFNTAAQSVPPAVIMDTVPELRQEVLPSEKQWNMAAGAAAEKSFRKRHPKVARLSWAHVDDVKVDGDDATEKLAERLKPGPVLFVYFTNGKYETYFLGNDEDIQRFKKNYGELPPVAPPPPPPPAAPAPPEAPLAPAPAEYPAPAIAPAPIPAPASAPFPAPPAPPAPASVPSHVEYPAPATPPLPPAPPPAPVMPANVKSMNINNQVITLTLLNGTTEKYDLNNAREKAAYIKKYGKLPETDVPYPAVEKYREAALNYQKQALQLKQANTELLSANLQQLKTLEYLKAGNINRLSYLKAQAMHLDAQKKYLANAKQLYLNSALKRHEYQNIYLQKQKSLLKLYQLQLKDKYLLKKPAPAKTGLEDGEAQ
jgi:BlaR1 peptidase M56